MATLSPSRHETRVYYPTNRVLFLILGVILIIIAIYTLWNALYTLTWSRYLLASLFPGIPGLVCLTAGMSSRLVVSEEGIDYYQLGLHAFTPWANIVSLGPPLRGPAKWLVLHLRTPAQIKWVWLAAGYREQVLQLSVFNYNLSTDSALRRELIRYAPQIFA